jgi:hypothetical protein
LVRSHHAVPCGPDIANLIAPRGLRAFIMPHGGKRWVVFQSAMQLKVDLHEVTIAVGYKAMMVSSSESHTVSRFVRS